MKVAVIGSGVYGMALANTFLKKDYEIRIWSKFDKEIRELQNRYKDKNFLFSTDLGKSVRGVDVIVIAIPTLFLDGVMKNLKEVYAGGEILVASKGICLDSKSFAYEKVREYFPNRDIGVMSGGTFAQDMMDEKIMGITLANGNEKVGLEMKKWVETDFLKVQYSGDVMGVAICGAVKNVMSIGFGILDGAMFPPSSKFLFLTEAIYEIRDLIGELGGDRDTIMSYAGIDDIMMTCTSSESRNYTLGVMIGKKREKKDIEEYKGKTTIEGLGTSLAIHELCLEKKIRIPIMEGIYGILYENRGIEELIDCLKKND